MNEANPFLASLRQSADARTVEQIEHFIEHGADRDLNRINALAFAAKRGLGPQETIAAFLHAAQLGCSTYHGTSSAPRAEGCSTRARPSSRSTATAITVRFAPPDTSQRLTISSK